MFDDSQYMEKFSLKYPDKVPKGYDISKMQYTFDFIYLVLKRDASIDKAVQGVAYEYGLSENYLMDYLIENKYLLNRITREELLDEVKHHNTKSLKKILKKHGLKASGKREQIEKKILDNMLLGGDYYLSSKSKVFYKNKKRRVNIFNEYLFDHYYFDEFNEFYMDNYRKKEVNIPIEFINRHIDKAIEDKNHKNYIYNNYFMAEHFYIKKDGRRMLEHVLRIFCMNLNPIWKIDSLNDQRGISIETYNHLIYLQNSLSRNIVINTYYLVWDSFNFDRIIVSKYDGYRVLKDILNLKDLNRINGDLTKRFYLNEDLKIKKITQKTLFDF